MIVEIKFKKDNSEEITVTGELTHVFDTPLVLYRYLKEEMINILVEPSVSEDLVNSRKKDENI